MAPLGFIIFLYILETLDHDHVSGSISYRLRPRGRNIIWILQLDPNMPLVWIKPGPPAQQARVLSITHCLPTLQPIKISHSEARGESSKIMFDSDLFESKKQNFRTKYARNFFCEPGKKVSTLEGVLTSFQVMPKKCHKFYLTVSNEWTRSCLAWDSFLPKCSPLRPKTCNEKKEKNYLRCLEHSYFSLIKCNWPNNLDTIL